MLKKYTRVCNFCRGTAAVAASRAARNILTEFGLNPLKFFKEKTSSKKKIPLEPNEKVA
jgi:hypothetical protein